MQTSSSSSPGELRRLLAGKLHSMSIAIEEIHRENEQEKKRLRLRNQFFEKNEGCYDADCERMKMEASSACKRINARYDRLVKFVKSCPRGNYEEFIEFLLMGGGRTENDVGKHFQDDYNTLLSENFYDEHSEYRKLWNDNLALGFPSPLSIPECRKFVPSILVRGESPTSVEGNHQYFLHLNDDHVRSVGKSVHNQFDKTMVKEGISIVADGVSKVSSMALKSFQEFHLSDRLFGFDESNFSPDETGDAEDERREEEELKRLKREAIQTCLNTTSEHLLNFIRANPTATYEQWIEDLHPENAHDGILLEGLGKTIDHRFFVEVSDHRRMWNEHLFTFLDSNFDKGRDFVPARPTSGHVDSNSKVIPDFLS